MKFLLDANMPNSAKELFLEPGEVAHVRDVGLGDTRKAYRVINKIEGGLFRGESLYAPIHKNKSLVIMVLYERGNTNIESKQENLFNTILSTFKFIQ